MSASIMGDMRHVLSVEQQVLTADGQGGFHTVWQAIAGNATVYAAIYDLAARKTPQGGALATEISHKIVIHHRSDVQTGMRLVGNGRTYLIDSVLDVTNRKEYLEIQAHSM